MILSSSRYFVFFCLCVGIIACACHSAVAQNSQYSIKQITSGTNPHTSPTINNRGDVAWSEQMPDGSWHIMRLLHGAMTPENLTQSSVNFYEFHNPSIDDNGTVLTSARWTSVPFHHLLKYPGEQLIARSTVNNLAGQSRRVNEKCGMSSTGNVIWFYEFYQFNTMLDRRLNIGNVGTLNDLFIGDDPDIDKDGMIVFSEGGTIYKTTNNSSAPTSNNSVPVASGMMPRIADSVVGTEPEIIYVSGSNIVSTLNGVVDAGVSADVSSSGDVAYEKQVNGISQVFVASQKPVAKIDGPDHLKINEQGAFSGVNSQVVNGGRITNYEWTFETANGPDIRYFRDVSYAWGFAGDYTVTLTVTDNFGRTGTDTKKVSVDTFITIEGPLTADAGSTPSIAATYRCTLHGVPGGDQDVTNRVVWFVTQHPPHDITQNGELITGPAKSGDVCEVGAVYTPSGGFPIRETKQVTLDVPRLKILDLWATRLSPTGPATTTPYEREVYYLHMRVENTNRLALQGHLTLNDVIPEEPEPLPTGWGVFKDDARGGGGADFALAPNETQELVIGPIRHQYWWIDPNPLNIIGSKLAYDSLFQKIIFGLAQAKNAIKELEFMKAYTLLNDTAGLLKIMNKSLDLAVNTHRYPSFIYSNKLLVRYASGSSYQGDVNGLEVQIPPGRVSYFIFSLPVLLQAKSDAFSAAVNLGLGLGLLVDPLTAPAAGVLITKAGVKASKAAVEGGVGWAAYAVATGWLQ